MRYGSLAVWGAGMGCNFYSSKSLFSLSPLLRARPLLALLEVILREKHRRHAPTAAPPEVARGRALPVQSLHLEPIRAAVVDLSLIQI